MGPAEIRQLCPLDETSANLVKAANEVADAPQRAGLSPDAGREASPDDCGFGGVGADSDAARDGGDTGSAWKNAAVAGQVGYTDAG